MTSNTLTDREALYCLCHVPGFGGVTIRGLKDTFGTYLSAWRVKPQELQKSGVLTERRAEVFQESRKHESAWRKEFAGLAQKNIRVIAECDPDYPTRFLPYKDRPAALFVKGSLPENEVPSVAIVGARACTEYGKEAAGFYAGELANAGVNIISGMAAGVSNIITFDAHDPRVQNAIPLSGLDNFMPTYQFVKALFKHDNTLKIDKDHLMVISPDEGAMSRAVYLANNLGVDMGMFYKRRDYSKVINGRNPIVAHEFLGSSVEGKTVIVVDDMIASGESMLDTAKELKERKAEKVVVCCTFGLFTAGFEKFDEFYQKGYIDSVVTTNLNYRSPELFTKEWYVEADMSKYIAAIINSLNHDVSIGNSLSPTDKIQKLIRKYNEGLL